MSTKSDIDFGQIVEQVQKYVPMVQDNLRPNRDTIYVTAAVILYAVVATILLPGRRILGVKLEDGSRISYKMNGSAVHASALIVFWLLSDYGFGGLFRASVLADNFWPLIGTLLAFSFAFTTFLYLRALFWIPKRERNYKYSPINIPANFWCGVELNPHLFGFEVKLFSYRPGFILASLINLSALAKQYETHGTIFLPMVLFQVISMFYIVDCFIFESGLVTMFDIIEENFGFMLLFGDYMWIPMVFSLQSIYLINVQSIRIYWVLLTSIIFILGYLLFRQSNNQKIQFKQDPTKPIWGRKPQTLKTARGSELLISGWWGLFRKPNYLGDILVAVSMSMACQNVSVVPYLYPIYLFALLLHRAWRDNERCQNKYGKDWNRYTDLVPTMFIPWLY